MRFATKARLDHLSRSDYCSYSWQEQTESMRRLLDYRFEWVLPGHGQRVRLTWEEMRRQLNDLVARMFTFRAKR
jgi:hypothetical protein